MSEGGRRSETKSKMFTGFVPIGESREFQSGMGHSAPMHVLILGAGYVGRTLAGSLQSAGHRTTCWVRSEASAGPIRAEGHAVVVGDLEDDWIWGGLTDNWDAVVFCASSSRGGPEAYQHVYGSGLRRALARTRGVQRFVYTSSTSVYGQDDGSEVTEDQPAVATGVSAGILQRAEDAVLGAGGIVLRLSGIYGPDRAVYWTRYVLAGVEPSGDPQRWVNMIHRDDAVSAIRHVLESDQTPWGIYNVTDDEPVRLRELMDWLGKHRPAGSTVQALSPSNSKEVPAGKRRGTTSKRISNRKLKATGWRLGYPSYREGYGGMMG